MTLRCHFFAIPALAPDAAQQALNAFCAAHRVLTLDRHFVDQSTGRGGRSRKPAGPAFLRPGYE